jgi:hypothetical protein
MPSASTAHANVFHDKPVRHLTFLQVELKISWLLWSQLSAPCVRIVRQANHIGQLSTGMFISELKNVDLGD